MCGRFTVAVPREDLLDEFGLTEAPFDIHPRYNLAPSQIAPVLLRGQDGALRLAGFRWGLVPWWATDAEIGNRMINARAETLARKPAFRDAFRERRCLVPADGWFEWQKQGTRKVPMWIHLRSRRPFAFAGLWERWGPPEDPLHSFTIVTTAAAPPIRDIHDRMPALLPPAARGTWLDPEADPAALAALLRPYPGDDLEAWSVSTLVNSPRNDLEACIEPLV
jgi:putative SOS response-associated peptidase YedK